MSKPKPNDGLTSVQRWRKRHPCEAKEAWRKWKENNLEHALEYGRVRNRTLRGRYSTLKTQANLHERVCTLGFEEYSFLVSQPCFYCGGNLPEVGCGIDRINSDIGYVQGNVRPCCTACNRAKNVMTETEFKEWLLRVFNYWIKNESC